MVPDRNYYVYRIAHGTNNWYCVAMNTQTSSKNTSFSLGDHFGTFIESQISQGRYGSASDVVRAGLRILEDQEMRISTLRTALIEGEQSGTSTPFDIGSFINGKRTPISKDL